jgi:phage shock protein A
MSDRPEIDKSRTIPLYIADQAIAAADAEIQKLREQIERMERTEERLHNTLNRYALDDMRLQAHIEQLTKAGNNLVYVVTDHPVAEPFVKAWLAAKEGKPHA